MNAVRMSCCSLCLVLGALPGHASTNRVPQDYATIHEALDASALGDTVLVGPGTYSDWTIYDVGALIGVVPDGVVLRSEGGSSVTVVDLAPLEGVATSSAGFACPEHVSGQTVIEGFHFVGFPPLSVGAGGQFSKLLQIRDCVFESPVPADPTVHRRGIGGIDCDMRVTNCTFIRCSASSGAAIGLTGGAVVVESCTFIECDSQAIRVVDQGGLGIRSLEVRDCLFQDIRSRVSGGCVQASSLDHGITIERCVFLRPMLTEYANTGAALSLGGPGQKIIRDNVFYDMNLGDVGIACVHLSRDTAVLTGNTFAGCHQPEQPTPYAGSALYAVLMDGVEFHNNIVAHTSGSAALSFLSSQGPIVLGCNVFWDNADGIGYELDPTDRIADPQFCDPDTGDLSLQSTSPCLPALSLGCGQIGALGEGCGAVSLTPESWGKIKSGFRTGEK